MYESVDTSDHGIHIEEDEKILNKVYRTRDPDSRSCSTNPCVGLLLMIGLFFLVLLQSRIHSGPNNGHSPISTPSTSNNTPLLATMFTPSYENLFNNWNAHVLECNVNWSIRAKHINDQVLHDVWKEKMRFWEEMIDENNSFLYLDVDALPLKGTFTHWFRNQSLDIIAQRGSFPGNVNKQWSSQSALRPENQNTLCAGFIFMRPSDSINHIIEKCRSAMDDQLCLNEELYENWDMKWIPGNLDEIEFGYGQRIHNDGSTMSINVGLLPSKFFPRSSKSKRMFPDAIIFHKNTPKSQNAKIKIMCKDGLWKNENSPCSEYH